MRELFTPEEDAFIELNYKELSYEEMSQKITEVSGHSRGRVSIKGRMYLLRLKKGKRGVSWSKEEADYLWKIQEKYPPHKRTSLINAEFGNDRTYFSVHQQLHKLRSMNEPKDVVYYVPPQIIDGPISITRRALIRALAHIDETAYTLASIIRRLTSWSMTEDGVVHMMTVTGMPVRYATPGVKDFLNIK